jgi:phage gp16-like protein
VDAILESLNLTRQYADAIARQMFKVDLVAWCNPHQLQKIIAALTYHTGRNRKKAQEPING